MNLNVVFEIAEMALSILKSQAMGKLQDGAALADTLAQMIQKTIHAYKQHTGAMPHPSLIGVT